MEEETITALVLAFSVLLLVFGVIDYINARNRFPRRRGKLILAEFATKNSSRPASDIPAGMSPRDWRALKPAQREYLRRHIDKVIFEYYRAIDHDFYSPPWRYFRGKGFRSDSLIISDDARPSPRGGTVWCKTLGTRGEIGRIDSVYDFPDDRNFCYRIARRAALGKAIKIGMEALAHERALDAGDAADAEFEVVDGGDER